MSSSKVCPAEAVGPHAREESLSQGHGQSQGHSHGQVQGQGQSQSQRQSHRQPVSSRQSLRRAMTMNLVTESSKGVSKEVKRLKKVSESVVFGIFSTFSNGKEYLQKYKEKRFQKLVIEYQTREVNRSPMFLPKRFPSYVY